MITILLLLAMSTQSDLIDAIEQVESGGRENAVGDNGKALGCMQIWKCVWDDVKDNEELNGYEYKDVSQRKVAHIVFRLYMKRYATKKRLGRTPTFEDMARIWNGGPSGWKKKSTLKYWKKVKKELE